MEKSTIEKTTDEHEEQDVCIWKRIPEDIMIYVVYKGGYRKG